MKNFNKSVYLKQSLKINCLKHYLSDKLPIFVLLAIYDICSSEIDQFFFYIKTLDLTSTINNVITVIFM